MNKAAGLLEVLSIGGEGLTDGVAVTAMLRAVDPAGSGVLAVGAPGNGKSVF